MIQNIEMHARPFARCGFRVGRTFPALEGIRRSGSLILIAAMFFCGTLLALAFRIPVRNVMKGYSYDVLAILIIMELFTNLIAETGIMQVLALRIAALARGRKRLCLMFFGSLMFLISSCLNNITAVMIILPIIFVLLNALEVDHRYVCRFFAAILALSNTGGAASPVGDFPAIIIMTSGITTFLSYLTHAFPLFALTSIVLIVVWGLQIQWEADDGAVRWLAIENLKSQYKNIEVRYDVLKWLAAVFGAMFAAWSFVPQDVLPPEIVAILGYGLAMVICSAKRLKANQDMNLKSLLTIASFLFFAAVVSQTGVLEQLAAFLQTHIRDPKLLVMTLMLITSAVAGIFSAGPAAAAMMPVIIGLCNGPLKAQADWIAVAYAAAICSGSSMFLWSATAGFLLSGKINNAAIPGENGSRFIWGVKQYLKYGIVNYAIQISLALLVILLVL
ncbi:MAG: SLC13 family permease [bacterium]